MTPVTKETRVNCAKEYEVEMGKVKDFHYARVTSALVFRYGTEPGTMLECVCFECAKAAYNAFSESLEASKAMMDKLEAR